MAEQPEAVALSHGSASLSYQALNAGANHLAAYLCSIGVRMDAPVAICLDRSFDFVIASLAAWKAGGAYLPIDPAWPADRREAVLHDAEAAVFIARSMTAKNARYTVDWIATPP